MITSPECMMSDHQRQITSWWNRPNQAPLPMHISESPCAWYHLLTHWNSTI